MGRRAEKIIIKTPREIQKMRDAGRVAAEVLVETAEFVQAGRSTLEIDEFAAKAIEQRGAESAFLGYRGFPGCCCLSLNEEVVHGIGKAECVIREGDVLKIDVGVRYKGWIGDNATSVPVGKVNGEVKRLLAATEESLYLAIAQAVPGGRLGEVGGAVEDFVSALGFGVVRDLVGHGVGRDLHEEPQVPNYRMRRSPVLKPGMILAIEPMINAGTGEVDWLDDGWTVVSADRRPSAHFEHTVLVTEEGPEILTPRPRTATTAQLGLPPLG